MLTKIIKLGAIAALIGIALARFLPDVGLALQLVVTGAALIVLTQAATMRRYVWMTLFLVVACLFNPVLPVRSSNYISVFAIMFAALLFFFSLELMKPKPGLAVASINDRMTGSGWR
jgi:hypothetical protein